MSQAKIHALKSEGSVFLTYVKLSMWLSVSSTGRTGGLLSINFEKEMINNNIIFALSVCAGK